MTLAATIFATVVLLTYVAWRRYLWTAKAVRDEPFDTCPYSLRDIFDESVYDKVPHQRGARWLSEVFSRSAARFPDHPALQIPHTGETLSFRELDTRADTIAAALSQFLTGPDQVVALSMPQDSWHIVAAHLGVLRAGGTLVVFDTTLPDSLVTHMIADANPVVVLTLGQDSYRDLPTLDISKLPKQVSPPLPPSWLDDPTQRLATIFYTSGTTGMPKGVESPHAGYINLALSYADYFDLVPGIDATTLTSSLGYDGSISEMYSAWVSGCAVVMLTKDQVRSGPDLIPILRAAEVTVLFCPPVLLSTLTPTPEVDLPYPLCRYIVPAGEAFPSALVEPWTRARRQIINTYGPTEASTDTSRQSLKAGEPITIGSPFPNVTYVILEIDKLDPVPHGEVGELCIGGVHLARGYRNLPEQTASRFIQHPTFGRLYRTGDKCVIDIKTQQVHFLGRIDTQFKVRGHRVEAQAVEDMLQTQFHEIEAAVLDYQNEALIAFVLAPSLSNGTKAEVAAAPEEWAARITATLARQLPAPSVPSRIVLVEKFVMKPVSGKIDRSKLPKLLQSAGTVEPPARFLDGAATDDLSQANVARELDNVEVLAICRSVLGTPIGWDDEFARSGGHSIVIARLALKLQSAGWTIPVRALMSDCNTPRKVAQRPRQASQAAAPTIPAKAIERQSPSGSATDNALPVAVFTALQLAFALLLISPGLISLVVAVSMLEIGAFFVAGTFFQFLAVGVGLYFVGLSMPFATLLWVLSIKRFLPGKVTAGIYPKWSRMHLRVWCLARMEALVLRQLSMMFRSAPLMTFALRQLGARVGRNVQCAQDAVIRGPLELVCIDDDVTIQTGAYIQPVRWTGQQLHIGKIDLESGCKIGMRAAVGNGVRVGQGTWVTPFTPILRDTGPNEMWEGGPARLAGRFIDLDRPRRVARISYPIWLLESCNIAMQILANIAVTVAPAAMIAWLARDFTPLPDLDESSTYFSHAPLLQMMWRLALYAFVTTWLTIAVTSVLGCLFVRVTAARPGLHNTHSLAGALLMLRINMLNAIQRIWTWTLTGQYLRSLAGVRFSRLGCSECDIMFNLVPETARVHAEVFWSNGSFTNMLDYGPHHLTLRHVDMPRKFFSGNNCVIEHGQMPSNFLLGVSTPCSEIDFRRQIRTRPGQPIVVAGNPPVRFASASSEEENADHCLPSFPLFLARTLLNDFVGIGLQRVTELLVFSVALIALLRTGAGSVSCSIAAILITEAAIVLLSVGAKRILVGNDWGRDHRTAFWSWRHFSYFFAQDCFFVWCRGYLALAAGTVLANPLLRAMGCRIGPRTLVTEPMQCSDWNAVSFGADCVVGGFMQFHTFENMVLKVERTHLADGCSIAFGATVMGGVNVEPGTSVMPLSLVLKGMTLPTGTYEGSPVGFAAAETCREAAQ
ncbi:MAG: AMP-binding protein [Hyphomicrobiaceae bacterium]